MDVFVAGGSGFVGRALCRELTDRGHAVTAASRSPRPGVLPSAVETVAVDVTEPPLADAIAGHDAVVNLVALPSHREPAGPGHEAVHFGGTRNLLAAAERTDVDRFVQLSGLGVDAGVDTAYFRAKRRAEAAVRESAVPWVIVRPSVVFGEGCAFPPFLQSITPPLVAPLPGGGRMRLQPIWVGDLAPLLASAVTADRHVGAVYEVGGPEVLTLAEVVRAVCGVRAVLPVPLSLVSVGARMAGYLPGLPFGRDQVRVLGHDNVVADNDVTTFDRDPATLATLDAYLNGQRYVGGGGANT